MFDKHQKINDWLPQFKHLPPVPPNNTAVACAGGEPIHELGDRIANLTLAQAVELKQYLESKGVKWI